MTPRNSDKSPVDLLNQTLACAQALQSAWLEVENDTTREVAIQEARSSLTAAVQSLAHSNKDEARLLYVPRSVNAPEDLPQSA